MTTRFGGDRVIHEGHLERVLRSLRDAARDFHDAWAEGRDPALEARQLRVELREADDLLGPDVRRTTVAP